jgi:hypothetical protein
MGSPSHLWLCVPVSQPGGVTRGLKTRSGVGFMPNATQEGKQRVAGRDGGACQLPIWGPCRGDRTVNHGYLQTEPEATSQAPQVTQVHSQSPCCFLEVGWNSRTQALQRTDVSLDRNPC